MPGACRKAEPAAKQPRGFAWWRGDLERPRQITPPPPSVVPLVSLICGRRRVAGGPAGPPAAPGSPRPPWSCRPLGSLVLRAHLHQPVRLRGALTPHTQGREWKMTQQEAFVGIDVSKARLDVAVLPSGEAFEVANDEGGWRELVRRLWPQGAAAIGLEASGGYERGVLRALIEAGLAARLVNPLRVRQFARACGTIAKNDRLD